MVLLGKDITSRVLIVGVDASEEAKGGMASVIQSYKKYFETLNYVCSWKDKSMPIKLIVFIEAIIIFLWKLTTNRKIKIVHIHATVDSSFKRKSLFIKIAKLYNKKIILHMHGGAFPDYFESQADSKKKAIVKILNSTNRIAVIIDKPWLEWFNTIGVPEEKTVVLKNTIEIPYKKNGPRYSSKLRMIYMGKLIKEKGIYDLLEVLKEHKDEVAEKAEVRIAGFFEEEKLIKTIKDYGINNIVSFEGFLSGNDKIDLLNWGEVLLQPSHFEAQSISILEGMSYGLAILASNVGGIPSIVKNNVNGLLFSPGNKDEIWSAIRESLDNPSRIRGYGDKGAQMVKEYFPEATMFKLRREYINLLLDDKA